MDDAGYTLVEMVLVIIMTSILAGLFSELLVSSMEVYTEHNLRKSAHIDAKRSLDAMLHDLREFRTWQAGLSESSVDLNRLKKFKYQFLFITRYYFNNLRLAYNFTGGALTYQSGTEGNWSNQYYLIDSGITSGSFTLVNAGGKDRITIQFTRMVNGKPMRMRTTVFPRVQGG